MLNLEDGNFSEALRIENSQKMVLTQILQREKSLRALHQILSTMFNFISSIFKKINATNDSKIVAIQLINMLL